jgi:tRNA-dihydrouridine synthase C
MQGYQPPVFWEAIGRVRARLGIPVIANGDIWTLDDFFRCRDLTGASHFMLGRGALADPNLSLRVARELGLPSEGAVLEPFPMDPRAWFPLLREFVGLGLGVSGHERAALGRVKQWLRQAHLRRPVEWFEQLKRFEKLDEALAFLETGLPVGRGGE